MLRSRIPTMANDGCQLPTWTGQAFAYLPHHPKANAPASQSYAQQRPQGDLYSQSHQCFGALRIALCIRNVAKFNFLGSCRRTFKSGCKLKHFWTHSSSAATGTSQCEHLSSRSDRLLRHIYVQRRMASNDALSCRIALQQEFGTDLRLSEVWAEHRYGLLKLPCFSVWDAAMRLLACVCRTIPPFCMHANTRCPTTFSFWVRTSLFLLSLAQFSARQYLSLVKALVDVSAHSDLPARQRLTCTSRHAYNQTVFA